MKVRLKALTQAHLLVPITLSCDLMRLLYTGRKSAGYCNFRFLKPLSGRIRPAVAEPHRLQLKFHITGL